jgi:hypothetical protein
MEAFQEGCALALALLFGYAAASKLPRVGVFAEEIAEYRLIAYSASRPAAWLVVSAEALAVGALILPATRPLGGLLAGGLAVVFLLAIGAALARGLHPPCGCMGSTAGEPPIGLATLVRSGMILAGALMAATASNRGLHAEAVVYAVLLLIAGSMITNSIRLLTSLWLELPGTRRELVGLDEEM